MNIQRIISNFKSGLESISSNKIRAFLTSLGIIFGTAAVIAMLAIGAGTEQEIINQMREAGSNNIIVLPKLLESNEEDAADNSSKKWSPGLTPQDAINIRNIVPGIVSVSPETEKETYVSLDGLRKKTKLIGVEKDYFDIASLELQKGTGFTDDHYREGLPVCIIGNDLYTKLFPKTEAIGARIKVQNQWFTVIGVLQNKSVSEKSQSNLKIRNDNDNVYIPLQTYISRVEDKQRLTALSIQQQANMQTQDGDDAQKPAYNYHPLSRLVIKAEDGPSTLAASQVIRTMLLRRHNGLEDFEIKLPEVQLKQEQKTKKLFNTVLGIIAGISLLVGGIGIMNIMLASVMERTREIGLRQSIGATRNDILTQFVSEAMLIGISGGIMGAVLGIAVSIIINKAFDILTIVSPWAVLLSFSVSLGTSLLFGIWPAKKASEKDPVETLRYE